MCTSTVLYVGSITCTLKGADIANGACNDTTWAIDLKLLIYNNITIQERVDKKNNNNMYCILLLGTFIRTKNMILETTHLQT